MPNRRSVLIGLGGLVAGGGALLGTGAFTTVEAERTVSIDTADDADAFLALEAIDEDSSFVSDDNGTIEITIDGEGDDDDIGDGLNRNAVTTFESLVQVTNQGTQPIDSITLEFEDEDDEFDDTFSFPSSETDDPVDGGVDILGDDDDSLDVGESVEFGLEIDLIDGGEDGDLPGDDEDFNLIITAEAEDDE